MKKLAWALVLATVVPIVVVGGATEAVAGEAETTLASDRSRARYEHPFTLSGSVTGDEGCRAPYRIEIEKTVRGRDETKVLGATDTDESDDWLFPTKSRRSASYVARVESSPSCTGSASQPVEVLVRVRIEGYATCTHQDGYDRETGEPAACCYRTWISGRVRPAHPNTKIKWQRKREGKWRTVDSDRLNDRSRFYLRDKGSCGGHRVVWPQQSPENLRTIRRDV